MTQSTYQKIADAVREHGENASAISRATGIHRNSITRALKRGWPEYNLPPLGRRAQPEPAPAPLPAEAIAIPTAPISREQRAIDGAFRNADGAGVALTKILNQLMLAAPSVLAKLSATGSDAITPREFIQFTTSVAKATESLAKANQHSVSTSRAAAGVPNAVHQHVHLAPGVVPGAAPEPVERRTAAEKAERMLHLARSMVRLSAPVEYDGEEAGMVDVEEDAEAVGG
jgi:hypothetical protein